MLKKIVMKNISSIGFCEVDFKKGNYKFLEDNVKGDVVNPIAFYGHNGSGKSSFFNGIFTLINLLVEPAETLFPFVVNEFNFEKYQREKKDKELLVGSIELFFELDDSDYDYYISTTAAPFMKIEKEYLKKDGEIYFNRTSNVCNYYKDNSVSENVSRLVPALRVLASQKIDDKFIQSVFSYISSFVFVNLPFINRGGFVTSKLYKDYNYFDLLVNHSEKVKEILKGYDEFPIYSIIRNNSAVSSNIPSEQYSLVLEGKKFKGKLPFSMISAGMKNQSALLSILVSMPEHSVLFVDELEQALHPSAIKSFLEVVKSKNIQLVFSSHNTFILQMLRPDQVYFSKWSEGFSTYYRLSKIYPNIREVNNIEKMYLSSVFDGAIEENE